MKKYFATLPTNEIVSQLKQKIQIFDQHLERTGIARRAEKAEQLYFGKHMGEQGSGLSEVATVGKDAEIKAYAVNLFRNLIQHRKALTTSNRLSFDPRAVNSDLQSMQQTRLARNVLEYYEREKGLAEIKNEAAERALVSAVGYVYMGWDKRTGRPVGTKPAIDDSGQPIINADGKPQEKIVREGDVFAIPKGMTEVIFDPRIRTWKERKWEIVESFVNKWDLCEEAPQFAEVIAKLDGDAFLRGELSSYKRNRLNAKEQDSDLIPVYEFYHHKTDSVPSGRYVKFLSNDVVLFDGPIPYQDKFESELPCRRISAGEVFGSAFGHTDSFDGIQLQQVLNVLYSIVYTNQQAFGIQMVSLPDGTKITPSHVGPMVYLKTPPGTEAKGINLTNTPAEIFKSIEMVQQVFTQLQGLNSVVTGDPDHNLKSGAALGRMQAMAIQYASNFQRQWGNLNEDCGTFELKLLKWFAKSERMYAITGKRNKSAMASFTGADFSQIDRVICDLGNPLTYTAAGRVEEADKLLEKGAISLQQYFEVRDTGSTDAITEDEQSEEELLQKENEMLMEGKVVKALVGDKHKAHIKRHKGIINDPLLRAAVSANDPKALQVVQNAMAHIQEHIQLEMSQDPIWFAVSGEQAPPPPPMPPQGPGGAPPPPMAGGPQGPQDLPPPPEAPPIPPPPEAA